MTPAILRTASLETDSDMPTPLVALGQPVASICPIAFGQYVREVDHLQSIEDIAVMWRALGGRWELRFDDNTFQRDWGVYIFIDHEVVANYGYHSFTNASKSVREILKAISVEQQAGFVKSPLDLERVESLLDRPDGARGLHRRGEAEEVAA